MRYEREYPEKFTIFLNTSTVFGLLFLLLFLRCLCTTHLNGAKYSRHAWSILELIQAEATISEANKLPMCVLAGI